MKPLVALATVSGLIGLLLLIVGAIPGLFEVPPVWAGILELVALVLAYLQRWLDESEAAASTRAGRSRLRRTLWG